MIQKDEENRNTFFEIIIISSLTKNLKCFYHHLSNPHFYQISYYFLLVIDKVSQVDKQFCNFSLYLARNRLVIV